MDAFEVKQGSLIIRQMFGHSMSVNSVDGEYSIPDDMRFSKYEQNLEGLSRIDFIF